MSGRLLFSFAIFLNAALLFWVQPLVGKMILPLAGGGPAVWNTCLFFFQGILLAGYVYAHLSSRKFSSRVQALFHLAVLAAALASLPFAFPMESFAALERHPVRTILEALALGVGLPFLLLSAGSPLLQHWFARTGRDGAADPYFLYAASNLGSFFGLIAYPILLEPYFTLGEQNRLWFAAYIVLILLLGVCVWPLTGRSELPLEDHAEPSRLAAEEISATIGGARRLLWLLWSFAPSSLLLGVTTYITTDVASVPLFWIVPLALYLLSFVLAFARPDWAVHPFMLRLQAVLACAAAINYFVDAVRLPWLLVVVYLLTFFSIAVVCHGGLARDRPPTRYLTEYYLWISLGGMLGGLFNTLLAPRIFLRLEEYPLLLIAAVMLRPYMLQTKLGNKIHWRDFAWPLVPALGYYALNRALPKIPALPDKLQDPILFGFAALACISFSRRPVRFGLGLLAVFLVTSFEPEESGALLFRGRSFFGVYRVNANKAETRHSLLHGTTLHGTQNLDAKLRTTPISYYYPTGPIGQVFQAFAQPRTNAQVGLVGLGTGALACYAKPGQTFTFFEIDPLVERIARNPNLFTYLRDCRANFNIIIGDARLSLARSPDRRFDLLVLDAFSSDAIPIHLLTKEALKLYLHKLTDDGIAAIHISNRYLNLEPVLGRLAGELGLLALIRSDDEKTDEEEEQGKFSSTWVIMTRSQHSLVPFAEDERWQKLQSGPDLWTDSYSNILRVLKGRR